MFGVVGFQRNAFSSGHLNQRREKGHLISVSKENGSPAPIVPEWPLVIIKENVSAGSAIQKLMLLLLVSDPSQFDSSVRRVCAAAGAQKAGIDLFLHSGSTCLFIFLAVVCCVSFS
jgi:hypothetical protein